MTRGLIQFPLARHFSEDSTAVCNYLHLPLHGRILEFYVALQYHHEGNRKKKRYQHHVWLLADSLHLVLPGYCLDDDPRKTTSVDL